MSAQLNCLHNFFQLSSDFFTFTKILSGFYNWNWVYFFNKLRGFQRFSRKVWDSRLKSPFLEDQYRNKSTINLIIHDGVYYEATRWHRQTGFVAILNCTWYSYATCMNYEYRSQPPEKIIGVISIVDKDKSIKDSLFK